MALEGRAGAGKVWLLGLAVLGPANVGDVLGLCLLPQSIVILLWGLSPAFNLLFAPWLLGEAWGCRDVVGSFMIVLGCAVAAVITKENGPIAGVPLEERTNAVTTSTHPASRTPQ